MKPFPYKLTKCLNIFVAKLNIGGNTKDFLPLVPVGSVQMKQRLCEALNEII